jgi:hypothetical protein
MNKGKPSGLGRWNCVDVCRMYYNNSILNVERWFFLKGDLQTLDMVRNRLLHDVAGLGVEQTCCGVVIPNCLSFDSQIYLKNARLFGPLGML